LGEVLDASLEEGEREAITKIEKRVGLSAMRNKRKVRVANLFDVGFIDTVYHRPPKKAAIALY
jgi:hypothetical protein